VKISVQARVQARVQAQESLMYPVSWKTVYQPSKTTTNLNWQHQRETDSIKGADFPLDLTEGRKGSLYSVYRRDTSAQAVRSGVSWSALFLTLPYLLYRQLFGTAIVYIALWVIAVGGLIISGLAWLDAGDAVTPIVQACTIGFALVAFIGLLYLPWL
jgi:hypothetical protein